MTVVTPLPGALLLTLGILLLTYGALLLRRRWRRLFWLSRDGMGR